MDLSGCKKISERGFLDLVQSQPRMMRFTAVRSAISDEVLAEMSNRWHLLEALDLTHCLNISERGVNDLLRSAFSLREINLSETRLAEDFVERLRGQYPKAKILF